MDTATVGSGIARPTRSGGAFTAAQVAASTATTEEDHPMFAPSIGTRPLADTIHEERTNHAALLQQIKRDRAPDATAVDRQANRRMTSRRLAAAMAAEG